MSNSNLTYLDEVTRLEIIDHTSCDSCEGTGRITISGQPDSYECPACHGSGLKGRQVVFFDANKQVEASLQDEGRTLKLFINEREA